MNNQEPTHVILPPNSTTLVKVSEGMATAAVLSTKHRPPKTFFTGADGKRYEMPARGGYLGLIEALAKVNQSRQKPYRKEDEELLDCVPARKVLINTINTAYPYISPDRRMVRELAHRIIHNAQRRQTGKENLLRQLNSLRG